MVSCIVPGPTARPSFPTSPPITNKDKLRLKERKRVDKDRDKRA